MLNNWPTCSVMLKLEDFTSLPMGVCLVSPMGSILVYKKTVQEIVPSEFEDETSVKEFDFLDLADTLRHIRFDENGHSEYGVLTNTSGFVYTSTGITKKTGKEFDSAFNDWVDLETGYAEE